MVIMAKCMLHVLFRRSGRRVQCEESIGTYCILITTSCYTVRLHKLLRYLLLSHVSSQLFTPPHIYTHRQTRLLTLLQNPVASPAYMYIFKATLKDFERPLNTTFEDSIHMPQNHINRNRRRSSRRYPKNDSTDDVGVVQATSVVPPEPKHVGLTPMWDDANGAIFCVPGSSGRNRPTPTLDAKICGDKKECLDPTRVPYSKIHQARQPAALTGGGHDGIDLNPAKASSPVMILKKLASRPDYRSQYSSPTFDHILKLREDVQGETLSGMGNDTSDAAQNKSRAKMHDEPQAEAEAKNKGWKTPDVIPEMEISNSAWAQPLYQIAIPKKYSSSKAEHIPDATPVPRSKRVLRVVDPIDTLSNAMEELGVFQKLGSSLPNAGSPKADTGTPPASVDIRNQPGVGKEADSWRGQRDAEPMDMNGKNLETCIRSVSSKETLKSFSTSSSDDFEEVDMPRGAESENNGERRKWYEGFRR
ncbi:hypothetical protein DE146DRAFT_640803 [Phaeosphaeria sp. MPI-PUGE-AT-0046c]|nr:hypothetical protein DE146DRAFT_640803 [Phaeosphaeria sp. MPI-PUGE-AT-0046c]